MDHRTTPDPRSRHGRRAADVGSSEPACLLIADLSGYTGYLTGVEPDHARDILADLIGTIVDGLRPAFRLVKLEGDAAFVIASGERIDGSLLLDTVERCYFRFRRRRRDVRQATSCPCNACARIPDLDLKFVVHHGAILEQRVAGQDEVLGSDVILVHRLLKNHVIAATGIDAYALFSGACADAMDVDLAALGLKSANETYDRIGTVPIWVLDLERRWREEESRSHVVVDASDVLIGLETRTSAPPQVAWEFLTAPGRRLEWEEGLTGLEVLAVGNRRGVGTTNHCLHGDETIVEEVLDWRPYDDVTHRTTFTTPLGSVTVLSTTEFEPTPDGGTLIRHRIGSPRTIRERLVMKLLGSRLTASLRASAVALTGELDAVSQRSGNQVDEPDLPRAGRDGPLAGLA
ncbi:hypothetical protein BCL57_002226 [Agromyces flavus]|uniref:Polyketide cyclase / dehydrase and lipid transport n=1 Tax=Agromyces flavus TaxID=589382 RepID=A0A1H1NPB8_9MICO|nr:DUF2652 domain-containing protein [Agromyces flavus]MCP2368067.1 hypothetical protein [Agromyces flavus]GGI47529.1 hypothetical protein GCM10010932_22170 [Agromyces flavus]SDS00822.1 Polyketide cyclase / dehydrase and lipid transport [Agromyces flavus]